MHLQINCIIFETWGVLKLGALCGLVVPAFAASHLLVRDRSRRMHAGAFRPANHLAGRRRCHRSDLIECLGKFFLSLE